MEEEDREAQVERIRRHRRTPIDDVIAEEKLIADIGGKRREVLLQIGRPFMVSDTEAQCPVAAWGLDDRHPDMHGEGTLQALNIACRLLERRLIDSVEFGGVRFYTPGFEDEGEIPISVFKAMFGSTPKRRRRKSAAEPVP